MPAATPIPRGPTVLTLYSAADLLTGPGCPVCRYANEAADRYLAWFALEALAVCPACEHDRGAVGRALDTLFGGLTDNSVRERCRELGGLCIPHLGTASVRRGRVVAWLSETTTAAVNAWSASPGWLAGTDHDADGRAGLRQAARASAGSSSYVCIACLAAARSETDHLGQILRIGDRAQRDRRQLLCAGHLNDLIVLADQRSTAPLLAWQAGCLAAGLTGRPSSSPVRNGSPRLAGDGPGAPALADRTAAPYAWPAKTRHSGQSMTSACRCVPRIRFLPARHRCASDICWAAEHSIRRLAR
jgi:hypothetical protein